jgi:hypothetical protein
MRRLLVFLFLVGASRTVGAQTASVPNVFTAGTAAKAADVNANFAALVAAINNLTARVSTLEGTGAISTASIAGSYSVVEFGNSVLFTAGTGGASNVSGSNDVAELVSAASTTALILNANGTFTVSGTEQRMALGWNGGYTTSAGLQLTSGAVYFPTGDNGSFPNGGSGTWSLSGNRLTLVPNSGGCSANITASGSRLFIGTCSSSGTNVLMILIRTS